MELQQLYYFKKVAQLQHMTRAAEELHLTQPALTLSIRRLEEELGVPLFSRNGKRIMLNRYGKMLFEKTNLVFRVLDSMKQELEEMKLDATPQITLMGPPMILSPQLLERMQAEIPGISCRSYDFSELSMRSRLNDGEIDLVVSAPAIAGDGITSLPILDEQGVVLLSESHPFAGRQILSLRELREERFAAHLHSLPPRMRLERSCFAAGYIPNIVYESASLRDLLPGIRSGGYVALVSRSSTRHFDMSGVKMIPIPDEEYIGSRYGISWKTDVPQADIAMRIVQIIREHFASVERG